MRVFVSASMKVRAFAGVGMGVRVSVRVGVNAGVSIGVRLT